MMRTKHTAGFPIALGMGIAVALLLLVASPARAQTTDADGDGVADVVDLCLDTPYKDMVKPDGCSVCPCVASWASHQAYVDCVSAEASQRLMSGKMTRTQKSAAVSAAKNSTCGTIPTATRCCTWRKLVYGSLGVCSVIDPAKCSFVVLGKWAEDRGQGTCYYNPCTW
jgi:hypothetical protein